MSATAKSSNFDHSSRAVSCITKAAKMTLFYSDSFAQRSSTSIRHSRCCKNTTGWRTIFPICSVCRRLPAWNRCSSFRFNAWRRRRTIMDERFTSFALVSAHIQVYIVEFHTRFYNYTRFCFLQQTNSIRTKWQWSMSLGVMCSHSKMQYVIPKFRLAGSVSYSTCRAWDSSTRAI